MAPGADTLSMDGLITGTKCAQQQQSNARTGRRATSGMEGESRPQSRGLEPGSSEGPKREALKMQTFALGANGTFEEQSKVAPITSKGERVSSCGQFIIDSDGNWRPNPQNMPSSKGARDPSDPVQSNRQPVKFGRRATPTGGKKAPLRPPSDKSYDTAL